MYHIERCLPGGWMANMPHLECHKNVIRRLSWRRK